MIRQALDEWMGASPVYNARNRALHNIRSKGVDTIMKGFQLDTGAPNMWLKFQFDVPSVARGHFWLTSCDAYHHVRALTNADPASERQICLYMEDPTFDATVMVVNPAARCRPVFRPPHGGDLPAAGPCRWEVTIGETLAAAEFGTFTDEVRASPAGQSSFREEAPGDDGLADYSGPFKRDFRLEDLCHSTLKTQVKEFALDLHLLQRASYLSLLNGFGHAVVEELISEHCAAMAPVYQARIRRLFGIESDDMTAILKLLQLDHHFVPEYLAIGVALQDEAHGLFWINQCDALADGRTMGVIGATLAGYTTGLQQLVQSANPRARVRPAPEQKPPGAIHCFQIHIDPTADPIAPSTWAELTGMNGLLEADLSHHTYSYED